MAEVSSSTRRLAAIALTLAGLLTAAARGHAQQADGPAAEALDLGDCPDTPSDFEQGKRYVCACPVTDASAAIYGSGVYTTDSDLCTAAVHAGAIEKDKGGRVTVTVVPSPPVFKGTTQHGVKSNVWTRPFDSAFTIAPAPAE